MERRGRNCTALVPLDCGRIVLYASGAFGVRFGEGRDLFAHLYIERVQVFMLPIDTDGDALIVSPYFPQLAVNSFTASCGNHSPMILLFVRGYIFDTGLPLPQIYPSACLVYTPKVSLSRVCV